MDPNDREKYGLPPQEEHHQPKVRHIVFHNLLGVLMGLGEGGLVWSNGRDRPKPVDTAPTFLTWAEVKEVVGEENFVREIPPRAVLNEVWPSAPGDRATAADVRNANVPSWA